jgi:quinoprotein glucose dehydrogenase
LAFDPVVELTAPHGNGLINRGVATWVDLRGSLSEPRHRRIFEATLDARLVALDATTGKLCADFGEQGQLSVDFACAG